MPPGPGDEEDVVHSVNLVNVCAFRWEKYHARPRRCCLGLSPGSSHQAAAVQSEVSSVPDIPAAVN